jgi:hypothetical protein
MDPRERAAIERLEGLRPSRAIRERKTDTTQLFASIAREQKRAAKALGGVAEVFEAIVPPELARECGLAGMRGGLLTIEACSSAARYALDRFLRDGGEAALVRGFAERGIHALRVRVVCTHA